MLGITSLVCIYLITGSLHMLTTFIQFPSPSPVSLITTNLICFPMTLFLRYNWPTLCEFLVRDIVIQCFRPLQNDHNGKSSYHLSSHKDTRWLSTLLPTLNISHLWLIYFVTGSLYLLISLTYFSLPTSPCQLPVCSLYDCFCFVMLLHLLCFLDSTYKWNQAFYQAWDDISLWF